MIGGGVNYKVHVTGLLPVPVSVIYIMAYLAVFK